MQPPLFECSVGGIVLKCRDAKMNKSVLQDLIGWQGKIYDNKKAVFIRKIL